MFMSTPPYCNVVVALIVGAAMVPDAVIFTAVAVPVKAGLALGAYIVLILDPLTARYDVAFTVAAVIVPVVVVIFPVALISPEETIPNPDTLPDASMLPITCSC